MDSFHGFENKPPRQPSLLLAITTGLVGAVIGGVIVAAALGWTGSPFSRIPDEGGGGEQTGLPNALPEEYQYTAVVQAVEQVSEAAVGISNYRQRGGYMQVEATGSGVLISAAGHVVTNYHVIEGADEVEVVFRDGTVMSAHIVGEDPLTDLAVLKITREAGFKYAVFSDSGNVRPGEVAIAIGNPLGLIFQNTVTVGVVSATDRQIRIPGSEYRYTFIQTDAAINRGNSGGPLVNLKGEIIGINSVKATDPQVEGIGFAIPSNTVRRVTEDIIQHGSVVRPYMGIRISDLAEATGVVTDRGVYIHVVEEESPAERAGLQGGDIIAGMDNVEIGFVAKLYDELLSYYPGDSVKLRIIRNGAMLELQIVLGEAG